MVNDIGLGQDEDYRTISKTGVMVQTISSPLTQGYDPLGISLATKVPGIGKAIEKIGGGSPLAPLIGTPAALTLDVFTLGVMRLPGISKLLGGMFKKATRMGDCMKWWSDSNIRGMVSGLQPYPFSFEDYMMKNFPQFLRQYQIKQADGSWARVGIDSLLNRGSRQARIANIFVRLVKQNPEIMQLQCAVQERAETGYTEYSQTQVNEYWNNFKEAARQEEYGNLQSEVDRLVAPFKVKETWGEVVKSREAGLLVKTEHGSQLRLPANVTGVSRGALVMGLKTPQGQPTSLRK